MAGRYYEQFEIGETIVHEPSRTVTEADNMLFCALTMNPQPLHLDAEFAKTTEYGQQVVNGLFTLGLTLGLTVYDTTLGTTAGVLAYNEITYHGPVFIGDTLTSETEILGKRESKSRPEWGIVEFEHRARKQDGSVVLTVKRLGMMKRQAG
jgi:acyl dehydratase